jgi:hypothetical protein
MTRWEALVRFDGEIRQAAMKLIPFGSVWVDKLGEAFLALNEDRTYLSSIVDGLLEEAAIAARDADRADALRWVSEVENLPNGDQISRESLAVLIELRARGFQIVRETSDVAVSHPGRVTSYARSNAEILRLGSLLLRESRT